MTSESAIFVMCCESFSCSMLNIGSLCLRFSFLAFRYCFAVVYGS